MRVDPPEGASYRDGVSLNGAAWSYTPRPAVSGTYTYRLEAYDLAGNVSTLGPYAAQNVINSRPLTPSLTLTKTVTATRRPVWPGDPVTYTIIAANTGNAAAAAVRLTDTLPSGLLGAELDWTGVLTAGQALSFTLPAQVMSATSILGHSLTNTAWLSHTTAQLSAAAIVTIRGNHFIYLPAIRR